MKVIWLLGTAKLELDCISVYVAMLCLSRRSQHLHEKLQVNSLYENWSCYITTVHSACFTCNWQLAASCTTRVFKMFVQADGFLTTSRAKGGWEFLMR